MLLAYQVFATAWHVAVPVDRAAPLASRVLPAPAAESLVAPSGRPDLAGPARVVDGDTLEITGRRVRLDGMDAPELHQTCDLRGTLWRCGRDATDALTRFLRGKAIRCWSNGLDRFGRVLGHCWAGTQDIGAWMVREGLAVAYTRYSMRYVAQEQAARRNRSGLWASRFEDPEEWRRRHPR